MTRARLETKIMVCIHAGDKDRALAYASDLANLPEVSFSVLRRTIDLVIRFFDADVRFEVLRKLILRALELSADASDYYLRYFVLTAIVDLADDEVAFSCAVKLYERRKDCGCLALKLCFIAFYNAKRFDLCREILLEFSRALPRNAFWQVAMSFLDSDCAFSRMKLKRGRGWYFNQPEQLVRFAESRLEATLRDGAPIGRRRLRQPRLLVRSCARQPFSAKTTIRRTVWRTVCAVLFRPSISATAACSANWR